MAFTHRTYLCTILTGQTAAADNSAVITAFTAFFADQAVIFTGTAGSADDRAVGTLFAAEFADFFTVFAVLAIAADSTAVGAGFAAVRADPYMVGALTAGTADFSETVGAVFTAFFADDFTVRAGIAIAADSAAVGADFTAVRADPYMIGTLAAGVAHFRAVITVVIAFGADFGTVTAKFTCRTGLLRTFKTLEAIYTVGSFAAVVQTVAAFGTMALVGLRTFDTQLAFFAVFVAETFRAGITFLTVYSIITGNKAGTAFFTCRIVIDMAEQAGTAVRTFGAGAAAVVTAAANATEFNITAADIAVVAVKFGGNQTVNAVPVAVITQNRAELAPVAFVAEILPLVTTYVAL